MQALVCTSAELKAAGDRGTGIDAAACAWQLLWLLLLLLLPLLLTPAARDSDWLLLQVLPGRS